jgi:hypothetical protein
MVQMKIKRNSPFFENRQKIFLFIHKNNMACDKNTIKLDYMHYNPSLIIKWCIRRVS